MNKFGWNVGKGLGVDEDGIRHPVNLPANQDSRGLGFVGLTKTELGQTSSHKPTKFRIGTAYDPIPDLDGYEESIPAAKRRKQGEDSTPAVQTKPH